MARKLEVEIVGDASKLHRSLAQASGETTKFGSALGGLKTAAIGGAAALGGALVIGLEKSVKAASSFQSQMELIQTQAGGSTKEVEHMSKALTDMASSVGQTPEELAKGLYHIESAGIRGAKALEVLKTAAEGAAVGHADLESVTNALVAAQKSGIAGMGNMGQAMGALNSIVGAGNMRMEDLTAALSSGILPAAKTFGLSITDVGAALATMTRAGVPATDAATRLRMTFSLLAAPTSKAQKELKKVGISAYELANTMRSRGLLPALQLLKQHLDASGLSATQTAALLSKAFGGGRSSSALLTLVGNLKDMKNAQDAVTSGSASFGKNWEQTQKTAEFATQRFHAAVAALEVEIGAKLLPVVTRVTMWMVQHFPQMEQAVNQAVNAIRPTLQSFGQLVSSVAQAIRTHWGTIGPIVRSMAAIVKASLLVMANIMQFVAALLRGDWAGAWRAAKAIVGNTVAQMVAELRAAVGIMRAAAAAIGTGVKAGLQAGLHGLAALVSSALGAIHSGIRQAAGAAYGWATEIGARITAGIIAGLGSLVSRVAGAIKSGVESAVHSAGRILHGSGEYMFTKDAIGRQLMEGAALGVLQAQGSLSRALRTAIAPSAPGTEWSGPWYEDIQRYGKLSGGFNRLFAHAGNYYGMGDVVPNGYRLGSGMVAGGGAPIYLVAPDGTVLAEYVFDGMRGQAQKYKQRTGRQAFA